MYEFSRDQPQYFALMFVDRSVPRISQEYERFSFAREMKEALLDELRACIAAGELPATVNPMVAIRTLMVGLLGVAVLHLSDRLGPDENPDLLAADILNLTIAGLRSGVTLHSPAVDDCPMESQPISRCASFVTPRSFVHESRTHSFPSCNARSWPSPFAAAGCSTGDAKGKDPSTTAPVVSAAAVAAVEQPIARFIRATGTLMAEEQADVAAETAGRVVSAPIERGQPSRSGRSWCGFRRPKPMRN